MIYGQGDAVEKVRQSFEDKERGVRIEYKPFRFTASARQLKVFSSLVNNSAVETS